jgi:hypothetical protein
MSTSDTYVRRQKLGVIRDKRNRNAFAGILSCLSHKSFDPAWNLALPDFIIYN